MREASTLCSAEARSLEQEVARNREATAA